VRAQKSEIEDKMDSLKQFTGKNGLCFKCGNKWGANHTCQDQISLYVLEEILDALEVQTAGDSEESQSEVLSADDNVMAVQLPQDQPKTR
jgi:hypothetical protein